MFFDFIKRNSRKIRKENGVYFGALIISIIAFYIILSLGEQDVMAYLKTVESNAVNRLLLMIPMLYAVSLFFVFFLVYFANNYQVKLRSHEFGLYLMMGMKRSRLFLMIMGETLWNGAIALMIGIPIGVFLTELISLITSRLIGIGIIGYQYSISWAGLGLTVVGFIVVQLIAMSFISLKLTRKEPVDLLDDQKEESQRVLNPIWSIVSLMTGAVLLLGTIFLCTAYGLAILYLRNLDYRMFALIIIVGIVGTFMLFRGLGSLIGAWIKRKGKSSAGLFIFTGRQLQENVLNQWASLAISSLLIVMSMVCFVYGISTALNNDLTSSKTADFTFSGSEKEIISVLTSDELEPYVKEYYEMKLGYLWRFDPEENEWLDTFSWSGLSESVSKEVYSKEKENLLSELTTDNRPYLISLSSYNDMLRSVNKPPIELGSDEVAMYSDEEFTYSHDILREALQSKPYVNIVGNQYSLSSTLYTLNVVADRAITLSYALIVPDDLYDTFDDREDSYLLNMVLDDALIEEKGLMQAMYEVDGLLNASGLDYESYLSSMGRKLFFTVAGSYTTIYLGIMFLIIANTVMGLKFLMQQKSTRHRYFTVAMLGASVESLCMSARVQIWLYFGLVILVALISSIFGIWSMVDTFPNSISLNNGIGTVVISLAVFIIIEICYILMIQRKSDEEIKKLKQAR
ncbi:FtsX-like permease family protein [Jeotgalibacillus sp. R-1-5s-1]|uniref:FtsX-like permease family protein n=1 Tax=Jeotgalibacillus sp. R-1-5s-1 TaxID=2555897 RepID=UPI00106A5945|nr:ABC transporter permease [Jeotgalibacillus sp. R-1-5s-1]TFD92264.1 ABC transporter permease [Jeotgalibacillus sp. R-1-5s-1]